MAFKDIGVLLLRVMLMEGISAIANKSDIEEECFM